MGSENINPPNAAEQQTNANITVAFNNGIRGVGSLADWFGQTSGQNREALKRRNQQQHNHDGNVALLGDAELDKQADKLAMDKAEKDLRPALVSASQGGATDVMGTMSDVGGLLGILSSINFNPVSWILAGKQILENSIVSDLFKTGKEYWAESKKGEKPNFHDILAKVKYNRGMGQIAQQLGTDAEQLTAEISGKVSTSGTVASTTPPAAAINAAKNEQNNLNKAGASNLVSVNGPQVQPIPGAQQSGAALNV